MSVIPLNPPLNLGGKKGRGYKSHFTDEKTEALKGQMICPRSQHHHFLSQTGCHRLTPESRKEKAESGGGTESREVFVQRHLVRCLSEHLCYRQGLTALKGWLSQAGSEGVPGQLQGSFLREPWGPVNSTLNTGGLQGCCEGRQAALLEVIAEWLQEGLALLCLISKEERPPEGMKETFTEGMRKLQNTVYKSGGGGGRKDWTQRDQRMASVGCAFCARYPALHPLMSTPKGRFNSFPVYRRGNRGLGGLDLLDIITLLANDGLFVFL